jgi:hypothetical protein
LYGLDAISANNGWAQALAGGCIVLAGLAVLSFIISIFPKIISWFEPSPAVGVSEDEPKTAPQLKVDAAMSQSLLTDVNTAALIYQSLAHPLGEKFSLKELYQLFNQNQVPHPHLIIRGFREEGILVPIGDGIFSWKV